MENFLKGISKYKKYLISILSVIALTVVMVIIFSFLGKSEVVEPTNTLNVKFYLPIANSTITKTYNAEELQYNKTLNCWEIHKGLDLLADKGDEVLACYDGKVTKIFSNYLEGTTIEITHENGLVSVYQGLNNEVNVKENDEVKANQVIGKVGENAGNEGEEESHVHFELIKDGEKIDPLNYIEIGLKD